MIEFKGVTKAFRTKIAVDNVSFSAKNGEIIGFVGPNGAGKTTTMRLILGYLTPTKGTITVDGLDPQSDRIAVLKKTGYLPENNPLYNEMRAGEYLQFIAGIKSVDVDQINDIINEVGADSVLTTKIEELSRGYRQRVGLAAALLGNPAILILDEPTSGLDPLEQDKIKAMIKKISRKKIVIFSTHILSEVEDVANRLIIINQGKIVYSGAKPAGRGAVERLFKSKVRN